MKKNDFLDFLRSPITNLYFFSCHIHPVFKFQKFLNIFKTNFLVGNRCYAFYKVIQIFVQFSKYFKCFSDGI